MLRRMVLALGMCLALSSVGTAQVSVLQKKEKLGVVINADDAHARALSGKILLVDVRTPGEWRETGVPESGFAITMHQDPAHFVQKLKDAMGGDPNRPLAVICAVGARTTYLQSVLRKLGFGRPINVAEGMIGGRHGPGWLRRQLPVRAWSGPRDTAPSVAPSKSPD